MCRSCRIVAYVHTCYCGLLSLSPCHLHHHFSQCYPYPTSVAPMVPPLAPEPPTYTSVWCSTPCDHEFSLFNTGLWVRTGGVWFSVLVTVCWEWWFPDSSMSLQRTQTHHYLWLHSIPCICTTFVQSIVDRHLVWFQVFAIVNSAAMNIRVHVSL